MCADLMIKGFVYALCPFKEWHIYHPFKTITPTHLQQDPLAT